MRMGAVWRCWALASARCCVRSAPEAGTTQLPRRGRGAHATPLTPASAACSACARLRRHVLAALPTAAQHSKARAERTGTP
jgi:hypothetical protein